ncbi:MAG: hypothetical protein AAGF11_21910 [Myxococcota bacterium]
MIEAAGAAGRAFCEATGASDRGSSEVAGAADRACSGAAGPSSPTANHNTTEAHADITWSSSRQPEHRVKPSRSQLANRRDGLTLDSPNTPTMAAAVTAAAIALALTARAPTAIGP